MKSLILSLTLLFFSSLHAKEIAFTFDDAPVGTSPHFDTQNRTAELIKKLKEAKIPPVMIFANPCKRQDTTSVLAQLKTYTDAGHLIANHTCSHPRIDEVGFEAFSKDAEKADQLLQPLFSGQKFFRFPFLWEGKEEKLRDQMRAWLKANNYRNGFVSVDNDDYQFSFKINQAKKDGKSIDYKKVEKLFLEHLMGATKFYDDLAIKTIGRSPKHVMLLHEMDVTVMYIDSVAKELRKNGWKIISAEEAFQDPIYFEQPKNTYGNNGLIAQIHLEKTGKIESYDVFKDINKKLDEILGLK